MSNFWSQLLVAFRRKLICWCKFVVLRLYRRNMDRLLLQPHIIQATNWCHTNLKSTIPFLDFYKTRLEQFRIWYWKCSEIYDKLELRWALRMCIKENETVQWLTFCLCKSVFFSNISCNHVYLKTIWVLQLMIIWNEFCGVDEYVCFESKLLFNTIIYSSFYEWYSCKLVSLLVVIIRDLSFYFV